MNVSTYPLERDPTTGRYILRYNASLYKESDCLRKVWLTMFRGLRAEGKDFKMEYGTAFHKAMSSYYSGDDLQKGIAAAILHYTNPEIHIPEDDFRSTAHLVNCIMQYNSWWKKEGEMLVPQWTEKPFALPYYKTDRTEVLLVGTLDMKATHLGYSRQKVIVDHKTTAISQVESYLNEYDMSVQMMMYLMVDNMLFPEDRAVGCIINGIFLNRTNKNIFRRSGLIEFGPAVLKRFEKLLYEKIVRVVQGFEDTLDYTGPEPILDRTFPPNYTQCPQKYGMCQFCPICRATSEDDAESVIAMNYTTKHYNPLLFQT